MTDDKDIDLKSQDDMDDRTAEAAPATGDHQDEDNITPVPSEIEALAAEMGWAPEDQWRGDPSDWVDAKVFIQQGHGRLKTSLRNQDRDIAEMKDTMKRMLAVQEGVQKRAYEQALTDLKRQQREAATEGDIEAYDKAAQGIDDLAAQQSENGAAKANGGDAAKLDPDFNIFHQDNPWYGEDVKMTAYAEQIAPVVARHAQGPAFYRRIAEEVRKEFPAHFKNPARSGAARVEGGGSTAARRGKAKKGYSDLPAEAKAACDKFVAQGLFAKPEDYVREYFEEEAT
jgi:hypothetical protein